MHNYCTRLHLLPPTIQVASDTEAQVLCLTATGNVRLQQKKLDDTKVSKEELTE